MRLQPLYAALAAAVLPLQTLAAQITIKVPQTPLIANPSTLPPSTHATLHSTGPVLSAPLSRANTFNFVDVAPGSYLLSVHCRDYVFENLRVDVKDDEVKAWQTFRGNEWDNLGEKRGEGGGRVVMDVRPLAGKEFYQARSGFSPLSFLKNPMILMGVFSLALIVGMPYLMENMDPETKAEFEEMQKTSPLASASNPAAQLQNFDLASWMAGKSAGEEAKQGGGNGGSKRRG